MSPDAPAPVSRKEKKALRDKERAKVKGKKRKRDEVDEQPDELQQDFIPLDNGPSVAGEKKAQSHKRKRDDTRQDEEATEVNGTSMASTAKSKKRKKSHPPPTTATNTDAEAEDTTAPSTQDTKPRFILFIGNLPYATTTSSLQTHFRKLMPFTLRHNTDKKTGKSKGFAFLEFENFDRMKTCLKLYHHSLFDPAKAGIDGGAEGVEGGDEKGAGKEKRGKGKGGARRINVELTAGGGGKAEGRKEKIRAKNVRLDEQRKRRLEEERKVREKERGKKKDGSGEDTGKGSTKNSAKQAKDVVPADIGAAEEGDTAGMHPSRLARMKKP